ncbi:hypothetical protein [Rhizorhabdus sp.]
MTDPPHRGDIVKAGRNIPVAGGWTHWTARDGQIDLRTEKLSVSHP